MAMIKCPMCGKELSERAEKCVQCGYVLVKKELSGKVCSECGKEIPPQATVCPFCGCPVEETREGCSNIIKNEKKKKNFIILGGVLIAVIIAVIVIINFGSGLNADERLAYRNAVTMKNMMDDPDSFQLYDEMFLLKVSDNKGKHLYTYTVFDYGKRNSFGIQVTKRAVFKDKDYVMNYGEEPRKGSSNYEEQLDAKLHLVYFDTVGEDGGYKKVEIDVDKIKEKMKLE